jgi:serine/threonine protein kinase
MGFWKKIKFWKKWRNNTQTKVDVSVSTENQRNCDVETVNGAKLGCVSSQEQTTGSYGGATPETEERIDITTQQEIQCVKDHYENEIKMLQNIYKNEKRALKVENEKLKKDIRVQKIINNRLKKTNATIMELGSELQTELQQVKFTMKKLQEDFETLSVISNKLHTQYVSVEGSVVNLRMELERVKIDNGVMNKYCQSKTNECEEDEINIVNECEDTFDDGKLTLDNFKCIKSLGEGAFGKVVLAKGKILGGPEQLYALKALKKRDITSDNICEIIIEKEALILSSGHPFITTLFSCFQNNDYIFFLMEYLSGGDLRKQLCEVGLFTEKRTTFYASQIVLAVQFLHKNGILHRDLKLENVLVGSDGNCKIADFGLSKLGLFRHCKASSVCGTPIYMAPELVKKLPYGHGVDWWAIGIMIFEMITGRPPFDCDEENDWDDNLDEKLDQKIMSEEVDFPKDMSPAAVSIVTKLLMKNPAERLGSEGSEDTVREHPFFEGIDWQELLEKRMKPPEHVTKTLEKDNQGFSKVLNDNTPCTIDQYLFEGFSFLNYNVKCG